MRRESSEVVAAAARRRLELLARDLGRELPPLPSADEDVEVIGDGTDHEVRPVVLAAPGRHSRRRTAGPAGRISCWARERIPPIDLRPSHLTLLIGFCGLVLVVMAWLTLRGTPAAVPVARTAAGTSASPSLPPTLTPTGAPASPGSGPETVTGWVVVDVAGKVRRPGVATLPVGSRVVDAVRRAGGARRGVDLSTINLARVLVDGEQILVGVAPVPGPAAAGSVKAGAGDGPLVNLNTADLTALDSLPGVGPVTAQKILDWRTEHGAFSAVDELLEVDGIGARTLAELAPRVTL